MRHAHPGPANGVEDAATSGFSRLPRGASNPPIARETSYNARMSRSVQARFAFCLWLGVAAVSAQKDPVQIQPLRSFEALRGNITAAAFSPSGDALACAGASGDLRVYDMPGQELRWRTSLNRRFRRDGAPGVVSFSPDGKFVVCRRRHLTMYDVATGLAVHRIENVGPHGFDWSDDATRFVYAAGPFAIEHRIGHRGRDRMLCNLGVDIATVSYALDGSVILGDKIGSVWRLPAGDRAATMQRDHHKGHVDIVQMVAVDHTVGARFEVPSLGPIRRDNQLLAKTGTTFAFATTVDGQSFAAGGEDPIKVDTNEYVPPERHHTVRWWQHGGDKVTDVQVPGRIAALAVHPNGDDLFVSTFRGHQGIYRDGQLISTTPGTPADVSGLQISPDGSSVAVNANGWAIHSIDGSSIRRLDEALSVRTGRKDAQFVVQERHRAVLLDGRTGETRGAFGASSVFLSSEFPAVPGPDGLVLVERKLRDRNNQVVAELPPEFWAGTLRDVAHASDGSWAVSGTAGMLAQWGGLFVGDRRGKTRKVFDGTPVFTVAFSPDARRLVYSCSVNNGIGRKPRPEALHVLDTTSFQVLEMRKAACSHWRFLDDHHALACVDGELQVWNVDRMRPVQTLPVPQPCHHFELSLDAGVLATHTRQEVHLHRFSFPRK